MEWLFSEDCGRGRHGSRGDQEFHMRCIKSELLLDTPVVMLSSGKILESGVQREMQADINLRIVNLTLTLKATRLDGII